MNNIDKYNNIIIKGARSHNLKNIDVVIPRNMLSVITGLSGSGKSSLAFDTIFAEGQRRYVESLSAYARQFLNQMPKPDVDEITGLSPAISVDQKTRSNNPRSTVATVTEIYDYLRVLYARVGKAYCPICKTAIDKLTIEEIFNFAKQGIKAKLKNNSKNKEILGVKWSESEFEVYAPVVRGRKGEYYQMLYDFLSRGYDTVKIDGKKYDLRNRIEISKNKPHDIDLRVDSFIFQEFLDNPDDSNLRLFESIERALYESDGLVKIVIDGEDKLLSNKYSCVNDGYSFPEIEPRLFSFNSPYGACTSCNGLGLKYIGGHELCDACNGMRLREEALNIFLIQNDAERSKKNIVEIAKLTISQAIDYFLELKLSAKDKEISKNLLKEILDRLQFLYDVGLPYLNLNRTSNTLSGGESQRIRLASQLGSKLVGATYILDEPTIGLHQRDNEKLINTLLQLRDLGNTVIVVEHDEDLIKSSDYIVDIGPKAGVHGGQVIVQNFVKTLLSEKPNSCNSSTINYIKNINKIDVPDSRRSSKKGEISIVGGKSNNIKNLNIRIPLGRFISITGVSGSGKSSFMHDILYRNLQGRLDRKLRTNETYLCKSFGGSEYLSGTVMIDQDPIGRTPRSNIATYTGAFTVIRQLFEETEQSKIRGWKANRFSFNVKGGRCEACEGNGVVAVEMHFLPTVYVTCDVCGGKRFTKDTLSVKFKNKNIYDVLKMTVEEGVDFFKEIPAIYDRLKTLESVGLGYLELGQTATTLSGGEAQRVKIATELYKDNFEKTIYLLDEPTVGLHFDDVKTLLLILNKLVEKGHTVMVIEHNLDVIKCSDYVIDFGPEGGDGGGNVVAVGTPEEVAKNKASITGKYLKKLL